METFGQELKMAVNFKCAVSLLCHYAFIFFVNSLLLLLVWGLVEFKAVDGRTFKKLGSQ